MTEPHLLGCRTRVHLIHQDLRQIEERMMSLQLRVEWPGGIDIDLIVHNRATLRTRNQPATLVDVAYHERDAGAILRANPVHVLCEIANLVERVPNRQLEFALPRSRREDDLHFN